MIVERGIPQEALLSHRAVPKWEMKLISENASSQKECVLRPTILQQELFSTLRMKITINMVAIFTAVKGKYQEFNITISTVILPLNTLTLVINT